MSPPKVLRKVDILDFFKKCDGNPEIWMEVQGETYHRQTAAVSMQYQYDMDGTSRIILKEVKP